MRNPPFTETPATIGLSVREGRLKHLSRSSQRLESVGCLFDFVRRARKLSEHDLAPSRQVDAERAEGADLPAWMQVSYLARPDLDAVVVELVAEEQASRLALIETNRDDRAAAAHRTDRLVERARVSGALERDRDAVRAVLAFHLLPTFLPSRGARIEPELFRDREPLRQAIDGVDRCRARGPRDLGEDETDRTVAKDDRGCAGVPLLGVRDGVHGDRQHLREVGAV